MRPCRSFPDRRSAGRALGAALDHLRGEDVVVLGLPRGGVPVADEVARRLGAPLDAVVVRKIGLPGQPELAMGAVGEGGVVVRNDGLLRRTGTDEQAFAEVVAREQAEVERRGTRLRQGRAPRQVRGRTAVVVDDGLATGSTARAAVQVLRAAGARRIVLAVPVAPADALGGLRHDADEVVAVLAPHHFRSVSTWYRDFSPTSEQEVVSLLHAGSQPC